MKTKEKEFSFSKDESLDKILAVINAADLGWTGKIVENPTVEDLKAELDTKRPIVVPVYAPLLHNPFYGPEGPDYHVLLLVGFDDAKQEFLVNDPGTRNGKNLRFSYETLLNAIHDYNPGNLPQGRKAVLFTVPGNRVWAFLTASTDTESEKTAWWMSALLLAGLGAFFGYRFHRKKSPS